MTSEVQRRRLVPGVETKTREIDRGEDEQKEQEGGPGREGGSESCQSKMRNVCQKRISQ